MSAEVTGSFNYLGPMAERPYYYLSAPPPGVSWRNSRGDRRDLPVLDARSLSPAPDLDREGFALATIRTRAGDLWDPEQRDDVYLPEVARLVRDATGASRVECFDHNLRSAPRAERGEDLSQHPVRFVHNDYTEASGPQRVRDLFPDEADALLSHRFAVINVWKPIRGPVLDTPLAFLDATSLAPEDFVPTDLRYADRTGEIYSVRARDGQRWFYYPRMQAHEALLLKCYDSDPGRARFTAHSAFDAPDAPEDAPARESIEVRTLAFFGPR